MPTSTLTFSVATYNIHRCIGGDGRKDSERVAAVLRAMSVDVVGLQEVESRGPLGGDAHQLDYLARQGAYRAIAGPTMKRPDGHYGNALLTRAPVQRVRRHAFDETRWEPRGVLDVCLEVSGRSLRLLVTHLGLRPAERRDQVAKLLDIIGDDTETPTILLGDFNDWAPWSRSRRRLRRRFSRVRVPMPPTFPAKRPLLALDQIWAQPSEALKEVETLRSPLSRTASDHLPLRAVVSITDESRLETQHPQRTAIRTSS